jgi:hypothetical protein
MISNLSPITPYLVMASATILSLWLFILVKADIRRSSRNRDKEHRQLLDALRKIQETIGEPRQSQPQPAAAPPALPVSGPAAAISKRAQVLRMSRRGDRPDQIAAALGMAPNEVALMVKVASLQQTSAASA